MAEYGAHHATHGEAKPSIFEVIGQENLVTGLRLAFRHIFKVLAESSPERYGLLHQIFDEGYTVIDSIFQYIHLRLKGGLFTETFYGLKRFPVPRSLDVSKKKVITWVFLSVVGPYLQSQLKILYETIRTKKNEGTLQYKDFQKHLAELYMKLYPMYHFFLEMSTLCYYLAYGLGLSNYHSLAHHITNTRLVPISLTDTYSDAWETFIPKNQRSSLSTLLWKWINGFVGGVTLTISVGAFISQFLEWWYNQEGIKTKFLSLPSPPPPSQWPCDIPPDICPICRMKRTNDTALSSSGFVFCYPCIFRYVQDTGRCPVTGYKSSVSQLIKIYHQE